MNCISRIDNKTARVRQITLEAVTFSDERVLGILLRGIEEGARFTVETEDKEASFQYGKPD